MTDEKRQEIADYDNATFYNDFVMNRIFDIYRDMNAVVIYFSDHGEEVYDYRDSRGRVKYEDDVRNYLKYQYSVPLIVWMSDEFMARNEEMASRIKGAVDAPFLSDNVSQMIMGISSMDSPYYIAERNPLDSSYVVSARVVSKDRLDYDRIMSQPADD